MLGGQTNETDPENISPSDAHGPRYKKYLKNLSQYTRPEIEKIVQEYYSFMIVREPTERLVSAYYNKFTLSYNQYFQLRYGRDIVKKYRSNPSSESLKNGNDVSLNEFIKYLNNVESQSLLNEHWAPYHQLCHPCAIQYDAIGHYEHLTEDVQHILNEGGIDISYPQARRPAGKPPTKQLLSNSLKDVSREQITDLWDSFKIDFEMFNYTIPFYLTLNMS